MLRIYLCLLKVIVLPAQNFLLKVYEMQISDNILALGKTFCSTIKCSCAFIEILFICLCAEYVYVSTKKNVVTFTLYRFVTEARG